MKIGIDDDFRFKNDKKNHNFLLTVNILAKKKKREKETNSFFFF